MPIQPDTYRLKLILLEPILGSQPTRDIATEYIAKKNKLELPEDEEQTLPDALEKGTTVFHRDPTGRPLLWDYQLKGMLKAAALVLNGKSGLPKNFRAKVNNLVFVMPRQLRLEPPDGCGDILDLLDYCERPLRAETAQGPRVALARSEMFPAGCQVRAGIEVLPGDIDEEALKSLLDYGYYSGLGAWRNGGWGRFRYELTREE